MRMLVDAMNLRVCVLDNPLFHGFIEMDLHCNVRKLKLIFVLN